jgi:hypothetical protein
MKKSELLSRIVSLELMVQTLRTEVAQLRARQIMSPYVQQPSPKTDRIYPIPPVYGDGGAMFGPTITGGSND